MSQFVEPIANRFQHVPAGILPAWRFAIELFAWTAFTLLITVVLQALALLLLVLGVLPFSSVRGPVGAVQRRIAGSAGDLYIAVASPIKSAALVATVQRDLEWLRMREVGRIVVIAHSQGGYVAHRALSGDWAVRVHRLITLGSGLVRISVVRRALADRSPVLFVLALVLLVVGVSPALGFLVAGNLVGVLLILIFFGPLLGQLPRMISSPQVSIRKVTARYWTDYMASRDPVLLTGHRPQLPRKAKRVPVANRGSVLEDHSTYWRNRESFVARVALELFDSDADLAKDREDAGFAMYRHRLADSSRRRFERVRWLSWASALLAVATLVLVAIYFSSLQAVASDVRLTLDSAARMLPSWLPFGPLPELSAAGELDILLIIGFLVVLYVGLYKGVARGWELWGNQDAAALAANRDPPQPAWNLAFLIPLIATLTVIGYFVSQGPLTPADVRVSLSRAAGNSLAGLMLGFFFATAYVFMSRAQHPTEQKLRAVVVASAVAAAWGLGPLDWLYRLVGWASIISFFVLPPVVARASLIVMSRLRVPRDPRRAYGRLPAFVRIKRSARTNRIVSMSDSDWLGVVVAPLLLGAAFAAEFLIPDGWEAKGTLVFFVLVASFWAALMGLGFGSSRETRAGSTLIAVAAIIQLVLHLTGSGAQ